MRIAFLGDIAFIGKYDILNSSGDLVMSRFKKIIPVLQNCDYVVANLEAPFTNLTNTHEAKTLALRSDPRNVQILAEIGVDVVSLANNHIYDFGEKGLRETQNTLNSADIQYFGTGTGAVILENESAKVALNGFCCYTTNGWHWDTESQKGQLQTLTLSNVKAFINESSQEGALPIVSAHWGEENTHYPKREHILLAEQILAEHNTAIIGHHPHVIQGVQKCSGGFVAYSLGNFCFDDCRSTTGTNISVIQTQKNKKGFILILDVQGETIENYELVPYIDEDYGLNPHEELIANVREYSSVFQNNIVWNDYQKIRQQEINQSSYLRLGRRNLKWLIAHFNKASAGAYLQRKYNQKLFKIESKLYGTNCPAKGKVAIYVGNFDRPERSAAGKRVYGNARLLSMLGYSVVMIGKEHMPVRLPQHYEDSIYYYSFPQYGLRKPGSYLKWLADFILINGMEPSLIIRYGSPAISKFDGLLTKWAHEKNIPLVADVVDWLNADGNNPVFNIIKSIDTFLEKGIYNKKADGIIAISTYLKDYYKKSVKNIVVLPPLENKRKPEFEVRDGINIMYAGMPFRKGIKIENPHKAKDRLDLAVASFCDATRDMEQVNFDIFGITEDEYLVAFPTHKELLLQSKDRVHFHGVCPMKEVQHQISNMDFTILLRERNRSTMAGFPTKVVESISFGTPVITTDTSDLRKYIVAGENGFFVDITDSTELSLQLKKILCCSKSKIFAMKQQCYEENKFLYSLYKDELSQFITSICVNSNANTD